jgi:4-amino-4-deoxy-L-arabinose transferase-like glycosyltransferase
MRKYLAKLPDWLWLLILSSIPRFFRLGAEQLWFDEAFTSLVANPKTDFWKAVTGDNHPPLWSMIQAINVRLLGDSELAFRLPSALISIAGVILVWAIALELGFKKRGAFIAGLLAAFLPTGIYFAQDGRQYAALTTFVLLALWGALRKNWIAFIAGSIGAVYVQNAGLFYVFAIGLVLLVSQRKKMIAPVIALGVVVAAWSPWAFFAIQQTINMKGNHWLPPMNFAQVFVPLPIATMGWRILDPVKLHIYMVSIVFTLIGIVSGRHWAKTRGGLLAASVMFGAPILLAIFSSFYQNVYLYRALMPSATALTLLWAYPLAHASRPNRIAGKAIMIPCVAFAVLCHYLPLYAREPMQPYADIMRQNWKPRDIVYHTSPTTLVTIAHYSPDLRHVSWKQRGDFTTVTDQAKAAFGIQEDDIDRLWSEGYRRAWVVYVNSPLNRADELKQIEHIREDYNPRLIHTSQENPEITTLLYLVELLPIPAKALNIDRVRLAYGPVQ